MKVNLYERRKALAKRLSPFQLFSFYPTVEIRLNAQRTLFTTVPFEVVVLVLVTFGWIRFGGSIAPLICGLFTASLLYLWLRWLFRNEINQSRIENSELLTWLFWLGLLSVWLTVAMVSKLFIYLSMTLYNTLFISGVIILLGIYLSKYAHEWFQSADESRVG